MATFIAEFQGVNMKTWISQKNHSPHVHSAIRCPVTQCVCCACKLREGKGRSSPVRVPWSYYDRNILLRLRMELDGPIFITCPLALVRWIATAQTTILGCYRPYKCSMALVQRMGYFNPFVTGEKSWSLSHKNDAEGVVSRLPSDSSVSTLFAHSGVIRDKQKQQGLQFARKLP